MPHISLLIYDYPTRCSVYGSLLPSALRRVIGLHSAASLPSVPSNNKKTGYGPIQLEKTAFLFDLLDMINPADVVESENPVSMEYAGQVFNIIVLLFVNLKVYGFP